ALGVGERRPDDVRDPDLLRSLRDVQPHRGVREHLLAAGGRLTADRRHPRRGADGVAARGGGPGVQARARARQPRARPAAPAPAPVPVRFGRNAARAGPPPLLWPGAGSWWIPSPAGTVSLDCFSTLTSKPCSSSLRTASAWSTLRTSTTAIGFAVESCSSIRW